LRLTNFLAAPGRIDADDAAEHAKLFGNLQPNATVAVFHRLLEIARPHLSPRDWNKLMGTIAAPPPAA